MSHTVKKRYQINNGRFGFGEAMLVEKKFNAMQTMKVNSEFEKLREITENRNGSVVAHSGMIASFKYRYNSRFLP
jgi:hypothetical protein